MDEKETVPIPQGTGLWKNRGILWKTLWKTLWKLMPHLWKTGKRVRFPQKPAHGFHKFSTGGISTKALI